MARRQPKLKSPSKMVNSKLVDSKVDELDSKSKVADTADDALDDEDSDEEPTSETDSISPDYIEESADEALYEDSDDITEEERTKSFSFERDVNNIGTVESTDELDKMLEPKEDNDIDPTKFSLKPCKPKNIYCNNAELIEEIRKYQNGETTDKLGELIIKIAVHMTTMVRFWRYPVALKEELAQNAIYRMLLSVPKFKLDNPKANAFGYLSMISYRDMLHTLTNHFKQTKTRDAIADAYLVKLGGNSNDERVSMLKQTLERSEEYNNFVKNNKGPKEVDTFALSKDEQIRRFKESKKGGISKKQQKSAPKTVLKTTMRK